jgi:hypothetical protein
VNALDLIGSWHGTLLAAGESDSAGMSWWVVALIVIVASLFVGAVITTMTKAERRKNGPLQH